MTTISPLRREIVVPANPNRAFRVFVDQIGQWWPLADHSVYGAEASVGFEGDDIGGPRMPDTGHTSAAVLHTAG
jgi:hypothetical protein